jgi:hypothetical protein
MPRQKTGPYRDRGVGQDEIDIVKLADVSIVVLVPAWATTFSVESRHHGNRGHLRHQQMRSARVEKMERAILAMLSLAPPARWMATAGAKDCRNRGTRDRRTRCRHSAISFVSSEFACPGQKRTSRAGTPHGLLEERLVDKRAAAGLSQWRNAESRRADRNREHRSLFQLWMSGPESEVQVKIDHIGIAVKSLLKQSKSTQTRLA